MDTVWNLMAEVRYVLADLLSAGLSGVLLEISASPGLNQTSLIAGLVFFLSFLAIGCVVPRVNVALFRSGLLLPHIARGYDLDEAERSGRNLQYETDALSFGGMFAGLMMALPFLVNRDDMLFHLAEGFSFVPSGEPMFLLFNFGVLIGLVGLVLAFTRDILGFGHNGLAVFVLRVPQYGLALLIGFAFWPAIGCIAVLSAIGGRMDTLLGLFLGPMNFLPVLSRAVTGRSGA